MSNPWEVKRPPCPECGNTDFFAIPDSLAACCTTPGCGYVWVANLDGTYERGASLQEWARDLYESKQKKP